MALLTAVQAISLSNNNLDSEERNLGQSYSQFEDHHPTASERRRRQSRRSLGIFVIVLVLLHVVFLATALSFWTRRESPYSPALMVRHQPHLNVQSPVT